MGWLTIAEASIHADVSDMPSGTRPRRPGRPRGLRPHVAAFVEGELLLYRRNRETVETYGGDVDDLENRYRASPGEDAAVQSGPGDSTQARALALEELERLEFVAAWSVRVVEDLLPSLTEGETKLVEIRYLSGEWEAQQWTWADLAEHIGVSERRLREMRDGVVAKLAVGFGLM